MENKDKLILVAFEKEFDYPVNWDKLNSLSNEELQEEINKIDEEIFKTQIEKLNYVKDKIENDREEELTLDDFMVFFDIVEKNKIKLVNGENKNDNKNL